MTYIKSPQASIQSYSLYCTRLFLQVVPTKNNKHPSFFHRSTSTFFPVNFLSRSQTSNWSIASIVQPYIEHQCVFSRFYSNIQTHAVFRLICPHAQVISGKKRVNGGHWRQAQETEESLTFLWAARRGKHPSLQVCLEEKERKSN